MRADFSFHGKISASKSEMNRALIIQSFFPQTEIIGSSDCQDVLALKESLQRLLAGEQVLDAHEGGTSFRFLSLRSSRKTDFSSSSQIRKSEVIIRAHPRLLSRPQKELLSILDQLNIKARMTSEGILIQPGQWKWNEPIQVDASQSSQFLSALFLSAWMLPEDLVIQKPVRRTSETYLEMTFQMLVTMGMQIIENSEAWIIPANQKITQKRIILDSDRSSLFAIACLAALNGKASFSGLLNNCLQPDQMGIEFLKRAGVQVEKIEEDPSFKTHTLAIRSLPLGSHSEIDANEDQKRFPRYHPIDVNLDSCPDLFPVLSVFCSFCDGESRLRGAPQLRWKESDRIANTEKLLQKLGIQYESYEDGIHIHGSSNLFSNLEKIEPFEFNPDQDHRMAMAAGILARLGLKVRIKNPEVVAKSFPEFWSLIGVHP